MSKKISELGLRDGVTAEINFPVHDGIQTYRVTAEQVKAFILANGNILLPMLKPDLFSGLTGVAAADDDFFLLTDTSDANKTKKASVGSFVRSLYRAVSAFPEVITGNDGTIELSGPTGTVTLPAANSVLPGKQIKFIHSGNSFTQVYTIQRSGADTIAGSTSVKMYGKGEVLTLESNGVNGWLIVARQVYTGVAYLKDVKASGTNGGAQLASKTWVPRTLNTLEGDTSFVTLVSGDLQFTLAPGLYNIEGFATFNQIDQFKTRLRNITDSATPIIGGSGRAGASGSYSSEMMPFIGSVNIDKSTTFELQCWISAGTSATTAFGVAAVSGESEVYSQIKITRLGGG